MLLVVVTVVVRVGAGAVAVEVLHEVGASRAALGVVLGPGTRGGDERLGVRGSSLQSRRPMKSVMLGAKIHEAFAELLLFDGGKLFGFPLHDVSGVSRDRLDGK